MGLNNAHSSIGGSYFWAHHNTHKLKFAVLIIIIYDNVESRGQGFQSNYFYIYEFMGEAQDAAAARKEGDKTEPVEESRCWIG